MSIKSIQLNIFALRAIILVISLVFISATYFAVKWSFGHTIALQATALPLEEDAKEVAALSIEMAPNDAESHFVLATLNEKSFLPEDLIKALAGYEKAVSVSPNDYRLWLFLGKGREQSGDPEGAEKALRKALELAPNYSEVHWILGNNLLRQGKMEEAFLEIRKAAETNPDYANPAVVTAWQIFAGDISQIAQKIGDSVPIKAGLAPFLAKQKRFDDALIFWNSIPDKEKSTEYKKNGEELLNVLLEAKSYRHALIVQTQIALPETERFTAGNIFNGDFEKNVESANARIFNWRISDGTQPQISLDGSQKHSGERSLIILFNSSTGKESRDVQQTIVVESGKTYKFEAFYRADLKALSTVKWEIVDANDGTVLASTEALPVSANWSPLTAEFTTSATTQAVTLRLAKVPCKLSICPISGKVWFDDLSLK